MCINYLRYTAQFKSIFILRGGSWILKGALFYQIKKNITECSETKDKIDDFKLKHDTLSNPRVKDLFAPTPESAICLEITTKLNFVQTS